MRGRGSSDGGCGRFGPHDFDDGLGRPERVELEVGAGGFAGGKDLQGMPARHERFIEEGAGGDEGGVGDDGPAGTAGFGVILQKGGERVQVGDDGARRHLSDVDDAVVGGGIRRIIPEAASAFDDVGDREMSGEHLKNKLPLGVDGMAVVHGSGWN